MKPAQILTQKLYKSDALTYGPHHHKQNRDQILDQTTHSMQTIYTNRRVDWINQWNNARGRERLDTVVIIINLVKQTRGWRKIQVKANTQNIRTRGKQKNTGKQQELHIRFPLTCVSEFSQIWLVCHYLGSWKKEYQGHHVSVGMFLHLFVVLLEFSHEFQHLNCQYWHSEFMFLLFLIWYHSVLAWRVATNTFRCFFVSQFVHVQNRRRDTLSTIKCPHTNTTQHQRKTEQTDAMSPWETKHSIICPWGADGWSYWLWLWQLAIWATNCFPGPFWQRRKLNVIRDPDISWGKRSHLFLHGWEQPQRWQLWRTSSERSLFFSKTILGK